MSIHIGAAANEIAEAVLITGDPLRAKHIAETMLVNPVCYSSVRGMLGFTGEWEGIRVSVQGTGMGIPSTAIYVHELVHDYGVKRIVRVGTCGALQSWLDVGKMIVAEMAYTDSSAYGMASIRKGITASNSLLRNAGAAASAQGVELVPGAVFSTDMFYHDDGARWDQSITDNVLAVEMETSVLYALAQKHGFEALTLLTVSDNIQTGRAMTSIEREQTGLQLMRIALSAITGKL